MGAYLGSYLKKKGENLARREDIEGLVEQVSAVTKATKEIEAKISSNVWDRQKQWELKRDLLLDAVKRMDELEVRRQRLLVLFLAWRVRSEITRSFILEK